LKKYQTCAAVFWVVLGIFVSLYSYRLGLGSVSSPGPGFFPFCLGLIFFLLAVVILIKALFEGEQYVAWTEGGTSVSVPMSVLWQPPFLPMPFSLKAWVSM
jgi:hypothetical protein